MTSIQAILAAKDVNLALSATNQTEAIREVMGRLVGDPRVVQWDLFHDAVMSHTAADVAQAGIGICIAHGRTDAVRELVLAVGRSPQGVTSDNVVEPVRLVFVAGIPLALSSDYLRVIGAVARICRNSDQLMQLLSARDPFEFIRILSEAEMTL